MLKRKFILFLTILALACSKNSNENQPIAKPEISPPSHIPKNKDDNSCGSRSDTGLVTCIKQIHTDNPHQVKVELSVKNESGPTTHFCVFQTPFENSKQLTGNSFKISDEQGNLIQYKGVMKKRSPPSHANGDYMKVSSGRTISADVDLTQQYEFKPGTFEMRFESYISELPPSNTITVRVE